MFSKKKTSHEITPEERVFHVRYIGTTDTYICQGPGCLSGPLQRIWDNSADEMDQKRVTVTIGPRGIHLASTDSRKKDGRKFPIEDISYCAADRDVNGRIFGWICKAEVKAETPTNSSELETKKLECHAVLCASADKAQLMSFVTWQSFQTAYKDWKAHKNREERQKPAKSNEKQTNGKT